MSKLLAGMLSLVIFTIHSLVTWGDSTGVMLTSLLEPGEINHVHSSELSTAVSNGLEEKDVDCKSYKAIKSIDVGVVIFLGHLSAC